jgi:hypothetical protein
MLDNYGSPVQVHSSFVATAVPAANADGFIATTDYVRFWSAQVGAITSLQIEFFVKNQATGVYARLNTAFGSAYSIPIYPTGDFRDVYIGKGNEFNVRINIISPGTAGNVATIYAEPIDGTPPQQFSDTELGAVTFSDAMSMSSLPIVGAVMLDYPGTGTTYERFRHNEIRTIVASGPRTTAPATIDQILYGGKALIVVTNISAFTTGGLQVIIEGKDPVSLGYYPILASAVYAAVGLNKLVVDPRTPAIPNVDAAHPVPRTFRIRCVHTDAISISYSVGLDITS